MLTAAAIKTKAAELGFDLCGVAPASDHPELTFFREWLDRGYAGELGLDVGLLDQSLPTGGRRPRRPRFLPVFIRPFPGILGRLRGGGAPGLPGNSWRRSRTGPTLRAFRLRESYDALSTFGSNATLDRLPEVLTALTTEPVAIAP